MEKTISEQTGKKCVVKYNGINRISFVNIYILLSLMCVRDITKLSG